MKKKIVKLDGIEDVNRFLAYSAVSCGVVFPEIAEAKQLPKFLAQIIRNIGLINVVLLLSFQGANFGALPTLDWAEDFGVGVYHCIIITNAACANYRISSVMSNRENINDCFQQIKENLKMPLQKKKRESLVANYMKMINLMGMSNIFGQSLFLVFMNLYSAIVHKAEPHPTAIPGDRSNPWVLWGLIIYQLVTGFGYIWSMSTFEWVLLSFVRLAQVEMICIRTQLKEIFSMIQYNGSYEVCIKKNLFGTGNEPDEDAPIIYMPAADHMNLEPANQNTFLFKKQCQTINNLIGECVDHHAKMIKYTQNCKMIFGGPILVTYVFTVGLSASWILTNSSSVEKNIYFLPFFSVGATVTLFALSYFGQKLTDSGEELVAEATNYTWNIFPLVIQKKLLMVILMSQKKLHIDCWGLSPLSFDSFYSTIQVSYSLLSFVWTYK